MDSALDLERIAAISAEIDMGTAEDDVLARHGLSADAWRAAEEGWLDCIAGEAPARRMELTRRHNAAFSARRRALGGAAPGA
ncbi:MAG: hypothetical protein IT372_04595, partial [Polyangiaceae bacterium]|nr:hypothetical protein [Polyangiaceae bacterium]